MRPGKVRKYPAARASALLLALAGCEPLPDFNLHHVDMPSGRDADHPAATRDAPLSPQPDTVPQAMLGLISFPEDQ